ncbi:MAG: hypothetical protein MH137_00555 [Flavobacteriales bacterium]|nr:hypothetical protein [Flavobacteriales bacterium]
MIRKIIGFPVLVWVAFILVSCEKKPEDVSFRNLWKNSPWRVESFKAVKYNQESDQTAVWDTTVFNYGVLKFTNDPFDFFYEGSGDYTVNGQNYDFGYQVGSVNGLVNLRMLMSSTFDATYRFSNETGKDLRLETLNKMMGTPPFLFVNDPGWYTYEWHIVSEK